MRRRAQISVGWVIGAAVLLAGAGGAGWAVLDWMQPELSVSESATGPVVQAFYATGTVSPDREYQIRSNVAGILVDVRVDKGDSVAKGQVLATISNDELQLRLRQAQAELAEKRERAAEKTSPVLAEYDARIAAGEELLAIAQREQKRLEGLMANNAATQEDLDHALDRVKTVWSDLEAAKAQRGTKVLELKRELDVSQAALDIAQWNFDQQTLRSPVDGVVLDRPVSKGTRLAINDHLMQVADVKPADLLMRAQVDEEDEAQVRPGQTVHMVLYSFPDRVFIGHVGRIYAKADAERRIFDVDVEFTDKSAALAPGMTGELACVIASKESAMVVPSQALQKGTIWVVRDGRLAKVDAKVGLTSVERVEVLAGLNPGERVVISPVGDLQVGQRVRTHYVDPITAAGLNKPKADEARFRGFQG